jgi:MFS family permease
MVSVVGWTGSAKDAEKVRRLPWILVSSLFGSVFSSMGVVIVLFYDELGLPKTHIGLLNALICLPGPLALVVAPLAARWGFKRTCITFYGARKFVYALLAASPFVLQQTGLSGVVVFTTMVMLLFGVLRVVAETAAYPWAHEYIPTRVRGQFSALCNIVSTLVGLGTVSLAGYFLSQRSGLGAYQVLILTAAAFGLVSVLVKLPVQGGGPAPGVVSQRAHFRCMRLALRDGDFRRFLWGLGAIALATQAWGTFLPLYLKNQVGLTAGAVVKLQSFFMLGALISSYLWGWAADRFGSRPVLLAGLGAMLLLPVLWMLMPRQDGSTIVWAAVAATLWGVGSIGYTIGQDRRLNVEVVPADHKTEFMALYYSWTQMVAVISPLVAGWGLDRAAGWQGECMGTQLGPYAPFFLLSLVCLVVGMGLFATTTRSGHQGKQTA